MRFLSFLLSLFLTSSLLASELYVNINPNPVSSGQRVKVTLYSDEPILRATFVVSTGKKYVFRSVNETLFNARFVVDQTFKSGSHDAYVYLTFKSGQDLQLPTSFQVVNTSRSQGLNVDQKLSVSTTSRTADLNLKIDELERSMDQLEKDKFDLGKRVSQLQSQVKTLKDREESASKRQQKEKELRELEAQLNQKRQDIQRATNQLKQMMKAMDLERHSLEKKQGILEALEQQLDATSTSLSRREGVLQIQEQEAQAFAESLKQKEKSLSILKQEIEDENSRLSNLKTELDDSQSSVNDAQKQLDKEKQRLSEDQQKLDDITQQVDQRREEIVQFSIQLKERQQEMDALKQQTEKDQKKRAEELAQKRSELDALALSLGNTSTQILNLEQKQMAMMAVFRQDQAAFEQQKVIFEKRQEAAFKKEQQVRELERELQIKMELLSALEAWIQTQMGELHQEYLQARHQNEKYIGDFDSRFQKLETLTRLIERRAEKAEKLNRKLSYKNTLLKQRVRGENAPLFRYSLIPYLGVRYYDDESAFENGEEYGVQGVYYLSRRLGLKGKMGWVSVVDASKKLTTVDQFKSLGLDMVYQFNPKENVSLFAEAGIRKDLGDSQRDMVLTQGLGFKYLFSSKLSTRASLRFGKEIGVVLGIEKHIQKLSVPELYQSVPESDYSDAGVAVSLSLPKIRKEFRKESIHFSDIQTHWSKVAVDEVVGLGIMQGIKSGIFGANDVVTRYEAAEMLVLAVHMKSIIQDYQTVIDFYVFGDDADLYRTMVTLEDSSGAIRRVLFEESQTKVGDYQLVWDGYDDNGSIVPSGDYQVRVQVFEKQLVKNEGESDFREVKIAEASKPLQVEETRRPQFKSDAPVVHFEDVSYLDQDILNEAVAKGFYRAPYRSMLSGNQIDYKFYPQSPVKRGEFMIAVSKALSQMRLNDVAVKVDFTQYSDLSRIPKGLRSYLMTYVLELGYGGDDQSRLRPDDYLTRAEAAVIIYRLLEWERNQI